MQNEVAYSYYEGADLIVEYKDGSVIRYPNFAKDPDIVERDESDYYEEG